MFFLLRMAFWLGIVLALLPMTKTPESDKLPQVAATDAMSAATAAISDMTQFCTRQPTACDIGGQAASVVSHRAQAGARKVYDFITEAKAPETTVAKEIIKDAPKETPVKAFSGRQDIRPAGSAKEKAVKNAKKSPDHTGSISEHHDAVRDSTVHNGTLTQDDLHLDWRENFETGAPL